MNEIEKEFYEAGRSEALPAKTDEFIWVLDASSGEVLRVELPESFPEDSQTEDYEDYLEANLPYPVRLKDCNWLLGGFDFREVVRKRYHLGN
jgi:hypothetical protein